MLERWSVFQNPRMNLLPGILIGERGNSTRLRRQRDYFRFVHADMTGLLKFQNNIVRMELSSHVYEDMPPIILEYSRHIGSISYSENKKPQNLRIYELICNEEY